MCCMTKKSWVLLSLKMLKTLLLLLSILFSAHRSSALAFTGPEGAGTSRTLPLGGITGDMNMDGKLDIFDLLALLKFLNLAEPPYHSDLDLNGSLDIYDIAALLNLLTSSFTREDEDLEFVVLTGQLDLFAPIVYYHGNVDENGLARIPYRIVSNKEIEDIFFVLGRDTLTAAEGISSPVFLADTLERVRICYFSSGEIDWYIRVTGSGGEVVDTSGTTEFLFIHDIICEVHHIGPLIGRLIDFPLVLHGPLQRLKINFYRPLLHNYFFSVDLNRSRADSVVFTDIDHLANSIMEDLVEHDSTWGKIKVHGDLLRPLVSGAVEKTTGKKADRLLLDWYGMWEEQGLLCPEDGNEVLLGKLGFPAWLRYYLRQQGKMMVIDLTYELDPLIIKKYSQGR